MVLIWILSITSLVKVYWSRRAPSQRIQSRYFPPHSFRMFQKKLPENCQVYFSIFYNNIVSINRNLENVDLLLDELDFHLDVIGISETKILQILMRATPIRAFQVMFLSMYQHHWPMDTLPLCWSITKQQFSWKYFKWSLWNNWSSAQFARLFPNCPSRKDNRKNGVRWQGRLHHGWF